MDPVTINSKYLGAIRGMFQYGVEDPYSGYMPPEQYQQALGDLSGAFGGIGAEMAIRNVEDPEDLASCTELTAACRLVVIAPLADTPAAMRARRLPFGNPLNAGGSPGSKIVMPAMNSSEPMSGETKRNAFRRMPGSSSPIQICSASWKGEIKRTFIVVPPLS